MARRSRTRSGGEWERVREQGVGARAALNPTTRSSHNNIHPKPPQTPTTPDNNTTNNNSDFTINALFYNINESRVEDLTGRGLSDLRAALIRTPLPARTTFADDPLRALRAVRFGTRLGFALDADIVDAAASDEVS